MIGYRARSGRLSFGAGLETFDLLFAFRDLTPSQVADRLKVTFSNPTNATLTDRVVARTEPPEPDGPAPAIFGAGAHPARHTPSAVQRLTATQMPTKGDVR